MDSDQWPELRFLRSWAQERRGTAPDGYADFVVEFKPDSAGRRAAQEAAAQAALSDTVRRLHRAGLRVEIRPALHAQRQGSGRGRSTAALTEEPGRLLLFVECPRERMAQAWSESRVQDWLGGVAGGDILDPGALDSGAALDPDTASVSERQRLVHRLITGPVSDGCAGIDAGAVAALHDRAFNRQWLQQWAATWLVDGRGLGRIREHFGEEVALYFAFVQSYVVWLGLPAALGVAWWAAGRSFAWPFGVLLVLWGVVFTETWARRESDIATYWGVHGAQHAQAARRASFRQGVPFANARRWLRRLAGVPVVGALSLLMGLLLAAIFALQTFVDEFYAGPLAALAALAPVALYSACLPAYTALCTRVAEALTEYEGYEFEAEHAAQLTAKVFVFRFLQDQLYLFLTAWVFVPYRDRFEALIHAAYAGIQPDAARMGLKPSSTPAAELVQTMLAGFVVTSQIIGAVTETGLPLLMRWWGARSLARTERTATGQRHLMASVLAIAPSAVDDWIESAADHDTPDAPATIQRQFVAHVAEELRLPEYSTYEDYAEMTSQFARVAFFSVAWPLAPVAALVNNWAELRTDAAKISSAARRPVARRVDSIGPWLGALRLVCWLSSVTNALLIFQFHPDCAFLPHAGAATLQRYGRTSLAFALGVLLFAEHAFLAVRWVVTRVMASWPDAHTRVTQQAHAAARRRLLDAAPPAADVTAPAADDPAWRAELERGRSAVARAFKTA
ncbi:hypothetical protein GGF46_003114 [Coemansia sp. RSA 552]|nr:hypothetical protein GGF46_003114 [Coemansia sp. RSA 552]